MNGAQLEEVQSEYLSATISSDDGCADDVGLKITTVLSPFNGLRNLVNCLRLDCHFSLYSYKHSENTATHI